MAIALCPQGHMLTDGDLVCPTCGIARETTDAIPQVSDRPSPTMTPGRPISELLDLSTIPTTNGNGGVSAWEEHASGDLSDQLAAWDEEQVATSNGHTIAEAPPVEEWTPPTIAQPAPAPTWTPPPPPTAQPVRSPAPAPQQWSPAPAPQRAPGRVAPVKPLPVAKTSVTDDKGERFTLLGGLDPRKLGGISRRTWIILSVVGAAIVITIAIVFGLEQWQRALNAEHELQSTRDRVSTQSQTIEGLSGRVLNLNSEIDNTSELLNKAQDQAAVSGKDLDALSAALGELSQARELMRAAVVNITKMTQALELKEFKEAGKFAEAASSQLEQAFVHEQRAAQTLN